MLQQKRIKDEEKKHVYACVLHGKIVAYLFLGMLFRNLPVSEAVPGISVGNAYRKYKTINWLFLGKCWKDEKIDICKV